MPELFDDEEAIALAAKLADLYAAGCGLPVGECARSARTIITAIEKRGFDKDEVRRAVGVSEDSAAEALIDLIWVPVLRKAEELSLVSTRDGAGVLMVFSLVLSALLLPVSALGSRPIGSAWMRSAWFIALAGSGVVAGIIHVARGAIGLAAIRGAIRRSLQETRTTPDVRLREITPVTAMPRLKELLFALAFGGSVGAGCLMGLTTLNGLRQAPAQFLDTLMVGGVLWLMTISFGSVALAVVNLFVPGPPFFRFEQKGANLLLSSILWSQLAALGVLMVIAGQLGTVTSAIAGLAMIGGGMLLSVVAAGRASHLLATANQHLALSADEVLRVDRRAPILYLRSFAADTASAPYEYTVGFKRWGLLAPLRPSYWLERRNVSFEEVICKGLKRIGPVIAIGQPGELLPRLGASRKYVSHGMWQDEVSSLFERCRLACLVVGRSDGLLWEFGQLIRRGDPRKALLIVPPGIEFGLIWEAFVERCGSQLNISLPARLPYNCLGVSFADDWTAIVNVGRPIAGSYRALAAPHD